MNIDLLYYKITLLFKEVYTFHGMKVVHKSMLISTKYKSTRKDASILLRSQLTLYILDDNYIITRGKVEYC